MGCHHASSTPGSAASLLIVCRFGPQLSSSSLHTPLDYCPPATPPRQTPRHALNCSSPTTPLPIPTPPRNCSPTRGLWGKAPSYSWGARHHCSLPMPKFDDMDDPTDAT